MVVIRQEGGGAFLMALEEGLRNIPPVAKVNHPVVLEGIMVGKMPISVQTKKPKQHRTWITITTTHANDRHLAVSIKGDTRARTKWT